jgi:hypothetical protein
MQAAVMAVGTREQLRMAALFDDAPIVDDDDPIRIGNCG